MPMSNKQLLRKAQIALSDLVGSGGYLKPAQAKEFIVQAIDESVLLPMVSVFGLKAPQMQMDKIVFGSRILHAATGGEALSEAKRSKPTTSNVQMDAKEFKAEVRLPYDVIEDNIEGDGIKRTCMSMMKERIGLDMEDIIVNGDTSSTDVDYAVLDGIRKQAVSNIVDAGSVTLSKDVLLSIQKTMPTKYMRNPKKVTFLSSINSERNYRDSLAERATAGGDKWLVEDVPVLYSGSPVKSIPVMPETLGDGNDETELLYCDPKNIRVGIWREVRFETDQDISAGVFIVVSRVRFDVKFAEEEAVVKCQSIAI
jgi:HK97 family phage major capsid protein